MWPQTRIEWCIFMQRKFAASVILLFCFSSVACLHKAGGGAVTPWERVTADNAIFAQINNSVEQGTEAVVSSGLLQPATAAPVIDFTGRVAVIHTRVTAILNHGPGLTDSDFSTITNLLNEVQASGTVLVNSGVLGVKNPKTQQTITVDLQSLVRLATDLLMDIQAARTATAPAIIPAGEVTPQ